MKRNVLLFSLLLTVALANAQSSGYLKEGFEEDSFPPEGWTILTSNKVTHWEQSTVHYYYNPTFHHEGAKSAINWNALKADNLITKQFKVAAGDSITFWFMKFSGGSPDTLYIKVSTTTNSYPRRFNQTIGTFYEGNGYPEGNLIWKRVGLSLDAFAGKDIYLEFQYIYGNGIALDDVALGTPPAADVRVISMDLSPRLDAGVPITPHAIFQNIGSQTQTFNVTLTAGKYSSTKTITALAPLGYQQVTFDNLILPSSVSVIKAAAYSSLTGDADTKNDTVHQQINVYGKFESNGWIIKPSITAGVYGDAVTSYTAGTAPNDTGYIFSISNSHTFRFNMHSNKWQEMARMADDNFGGSAFTYKGKIYYIGDYENDVEHNTGFSIVTGRVTIYDIATNTWTTGAEPADDGVENFASCQYKDSLIYVICGTTYGDHDESDYDVYRVAIYNAASNTWSSATGFPGIPSHGIRAGIVNNTIIIVGGETIFGNLLSQAYRGDINPSHPEEITWTRITNYPDGPTAYLGATGIAGAKTPLVYFTGGDSTYLHNHKSTWAYDIDARRWQHGPDKPVGGAGSGLTPFVFRDTVYIASVSGYDSAQAGVANEWLEIGTTQNVLPIHLISFMAALQNNKTLLSWKVSEDGTGGYYIIQRAADAVHFADMSETINAGLASEVMAYTCCDFSPLKGYNYYRIKIVNSDGSISYSEIKTINNTIANASLYSFSIYPNPTRGLLNIVLQNKSGKDAIIDITVSDAAGRKIVNENKTVSISLSLTYKLKPGIYIVNLLTQDKTWKQNQKVVVE